jgi:Fe-S-cluster-containing dehydrogenase component
VSACKEANHMPPAEDAPDLSQWNQGTWNTALDISERTLNVIKVYQQGAATQKDSEIDGFAFMKRHCLHCVDPSCVSVCPVSAMRKDVDTGLWLRRICHCAARLHP